MQITVRFDPEIYKSGDAGGDVVTGPLTRHRILTTTSTELITSSGDV